MPDETLWAKMSVPQLSRHGVGVDKNTSYKLTDKVDHDGNFLEFPHVTVIHPLLSSNNNPKILSSLPLRLHQTVGVYLSPLPSYHATLLSGPRHVDLNGPAHPSNLFAECLQEPCWEQMASYLEQVQYAPTDLVVTNVVVCSSGGGVTVHLHHSTNTEATRKVRQELRAIGVATGKLKESLEALTNLGKKAKRRRQVLWLHSHLMEPKDRAWQVTIAYPRKSGGPIPEEIQEQVKSMVREAFESGFVSLEPAHLCLSTDMTVHVPWNGKPPQRLQYPKRPQKPI